MKSLIAALLLLFPAMAWGVEADVYCQSGTSSTGAPIFLPASNTNPCPISTGTATITWIAPTLVSVTTTATVAPAGQKIIIISNATASGGGTLTLNLFGTAAVINTGVVLQPGQVATISGQPVGTAITGVCSTGTCLVGVQAGS